MINNSNTVLGQNFITNKYPFIIQSFVLIPQLSVNLYNYTPHSCDTVAHICRAGMKTVDNVRANDPATHIVDILILMDDLWSAFFDAWVSFTAVAISPVDPNVQLQNLKITQDASNILSVFTNWDEARQKCPFNSISDAFNTVLGGVTP